MFGYWKQTPLEKQLIYPTLVINKLIFNNLTGRSRAQTVLFYAMGVNLCLLEVFHVGYLFIKDTNIIEFATMEETITSTMEAILRLVALGIHRNVYKKLLVTMSKEFWPSHAFGEANEQRCAYFSKVMNMFSHINTATAFVTMGVLLCLPLIHRTKELPFKIWFPLIDKYSEPYFEILTVWQWITNYWTVLFVIMCYDYIYVALSTSAICQLKMLQTALRNINSGDQESLQIVQFLLKESENREAKRSNESQYDDLKGKCRELLANQIIPHKSEEERRLDALRVCIEHHDMITTFISEIYATYSMPFLAQFAGTFNALCFSGYILVTIHIDDVITILHIVTYILVHLIEIFVLLKIADELHLQNLKVAEAAFDSGWHKFYSPSFRRRLIMIIQRAQNVRQFSAAGILTCDLTGLLSIVKSSFSVITLLQKVDKK